MREGGCWSSCGSTVKEVGGHQELEGDFGWDGELWDLCGAVGVLDFVGEVHANLLEDVRRDLSKVHLVRLVLTEKHVVRSSIAGIAGSFLVQFQKNSRPGKKKLKAYFA